MIIRCISIIVFGLSGLSWQIQGMHVSMREGQSLSIIRSIRGGSTLLMDNQTIPEGDSNHEINIKVKPQWNMREKRRIHCMDSDRVALALRLTCQLNRRTLSHTYYDEYTIQNHADFYSKGCNDHPGAKENLDLEKFIQQLYEAFDFENIPLIPALTMLYLDRACSTDTPRKTSVNESSYTCPMLDMGNIHKLFLVANILAIRAYRYQIPIDENYHDEITIQLYRQFLESTSPDVQQWIGNISIAELADMMQMMQASMGYKGLTVSLNEVNQLVHSFSALFEKYD